MQKKYDSTYEVGFHNHQYNHVEYELQYLKLNLKKMRLIQSSTPMSYNS